MKVLLAIMVGGAVGSVLRYGLAKTIQKILESDFPYGTLTVNVLGSLAIGFLSVMLLERWSSNIELRAFIMVGLLGGFTTFSAFSLETMTLFESGAPLKALLNVISSVVLCCTATWLGILTGRSL